MAAHVVVAINPAASGARDGAAGEEAVARLRAAGHEVTRLVEPDRESLERALARIVAAAAPDAVVAVGGDGTVHAVVNAIARTGVALGIVPAGSGNDLARGFGLPHQDQGAALDRILAALERGEPRPVDAVRVSTGRWYAGVLSAGFDAGVTERAYGMRRLRGRPRYVVALLLELRRLTPHRYRMTIDRDHRQVDAVLITVANTTSIGAGMRIVPSASPDDGLLDVLVATPLSRRALLRLFPRVFTGTHVLDEHVAVERGRVVTLDLVDRVVPAPTAYADGEPVGPLPLTLEVVPGALQVLG